jgi:hypothetical protein
LFEEAAIDQQAGKQVSNKAANDYSAELSDDAAIRLDDRGALPAAVQNFRRTRKVVGG